LVIAMRAPPSSKSVHGESPGLSQLGSRIEASKQHIRIREVERDEIREILAFAHFAFLHHQLSEVQRLYFLRKYWAALQTVEQQLHRHRHTLQLAERELARQTLMDQSTVPLTHLADQIRALQSCSLNTSPLEQRILRQLETMRQQINRLK
jgi:hypothetical protein